MKNKLPTLVSPIAPDLRQFLNRMREAFESPEGLLTRDDLVGTGVFQTNTTGGLDFLEPGEAQSCIAPPEAVNLVASGAMTSIILTWDNEPYASTPCYAYAEVWRSSSSNLGSSVLIGTTSSSVYADAVGSDSTGNYYWIRFVNVLNDKGPFATLGVLGETEQDLAYVFAQLTAAYGDTSAAPFFQLNSDTTINGVVISAGTYIKEAKIYNGSIVNAKIGALAVDDAKIAIAAIKTAKIDDLAVTTAKIDDLSVTDAKITALNATKIDAGTIQAARIGAGTIDATKLKITGTGAIVASSIGALGSFYQDNIPTSLAIGDIWVDTDDNNKLYRSNAVGANTISPVLTGSINPTASVNVVGVGTLFTTELSVGDSIIVSGETREVASIASATSLTVTVAFTDVANDENPERVGWVSVQDVAISIAQEIADGEIVGFYQDDEPTDANSDPDPSFGDIWIKTNTTLVGGLLPASSISRYENSNGGSSGDLDWELSPASAIGLLYLDTFNAAADIVTNQNAFNNFVTTTYADDLNAIQLQVDGSITTWFYAVVPTLLNVPYTTWTTDALKAQHLADLYYDTVTGYAYRFASNGATPPVYSWIRITDTDVTLALSNASKAQDAADGKRRVFITKPNTTTGYDAAVTPAVTAYDIGDLWLVQADNDHGTYGEDDLLRCGTAQNKSSSNTYADAHWVLATKYTDDTVAASKIKTYFVTSAPSGLTASDVGDLWVNTHADGKNEISRWNGSGWDSIRDLTIAEARTIADEAIDLLGEIASDTIVTPSEKLQIKPFWDAIVAEQAGVVAAGTDVVVGTTAYSTSYGVLNTYLNTTLTVFADMTASTNLGISGDLQFAAAGQVFEDDDDVDDIHIASDPNTSGRFVAVYNLDYTTSGAKHNYGYAKVGTLDSAGSFTWGARTVFHGVSDSVYEEKYCRVAFDPSNPDKFVVAWLRKDNGDGVARVGTITDTTISFGTEATFTTDAVKSLDIKFDPHEAGGFVVVYIEESSNTYVYGKVGQVDTSGEGTTISFGTEFTVDSSTESNFVSLDFDHKTANQFVVMWKDHTVNQTYGSPAIRKGIVDYSGNTSITWGNQSSMGGYCDRHTSISFDPQTANKFVCAWRGGSGTSSNNGQVRIGVVNGSSFTKGTSVTFNSGVTDRVSVAFDPHSAYRLAISFRSALDDSTVKIGVVSGNNLTVGNPVIYDEYYLSSYSNDYRTTIVYDPFTEGRFIVAYREFSGSPDSGSVRVGTYSGRSAWEENWANYYVEKQALLDAIASNLNSISETIKGNVYYSGTTEIDGGKIRADSIDINEITVTPSDVGVGTASGDDSMRISSDKIEIYNGGVLRVKLGNLAP